MYGGNTKKHVKELKKYELQFKLRRDTQKNELFYKNKRYRYTTFNYKL